MTNPTMSKAKRILKARDDSNKRVLAQGIRRTPEPSAAENTEWPTARSLSSQQAYAQNWTRLDHEEKKTSFHILCECDAVYQKILFHQTWPIGTPDETLES